MLPFHWFMAVIFAPKVIAFDCPLLACAYGSFLDYPIPFAALCPIERKAEEVECVTVPLLWRMKVHKPGLLWVDAEAVFLKPLWQHLHNALCIFLMLAANNKVIGVAHQKYIPSHPRFYVFNEPFIDHIMQIDVGKER